jgi:hypothetical protein
VKWGRADFRVYGQVRLADPAALTVLAATLPPEAATRDRDTLDIDHEGAFFDTQDFLDAAARLLGPGESGHLDILDEDARIVTRYDLAPGGHRHVSHAYDDILEHTKNEGNW